MVSVSDKKKQVFWYNFSSYTSYFLALISIVYLYEINIEIVGKIKYVESIALALFPFLSLGLSQAFVNFLPVIEDYHAKTLYGMSVFLVFVFSVVILVLLILINMIYPIYGFNLILYGVIVSSSLSLFEVMKSRSVTLGKSILPVVFEKITPKILLILILLVFGKLSYENNSFLVFYSGFYFLFILFIFSYLNKFSKARFSFKSEYLFENFEKKDLIRYMLFSILSSLLTFLTFKIDGLLVPSFFSMKANGFFSIALFVAGLVALPASGLFAINAPQVSEMMKNSNLIDLNRKYKEVSKLIFFRAFITLTLVFCVSPQILSYLFKGNNDYLNLVPIINVLCIGSLFSVATGFNNEIIMFSKYYRYNYIFTALLMVLNLCLFFYFLNYTTYGLLGVAYTITISITLFNLLKMYFIKVKFDLLPLDKKYLVLFLLMSLVFVLAYFLPNTNIVILDVFIKIIVVLGLNTLILNRIKLIDGKSIA